MGGRTSATRSAPIFAALGDATRLGLVARLGIDGPQSIARLTAGSEMTRQAVTKHLRVLEDAGLVRSARQGRESRWILEPTSLDAARTDLELISALWTQRLDALEKHLDSMSEPSEPGKKQRPNASRRRGRRRSRKP